MARERGAETERDYWRTLIEVTDAVVTVGMAERLQQLGGTFDIESSTGGTTLRAQIPLPANTR